MFRLGVWVIRLALFAGGAAALAQTYPDRPLRLVVPQGAATATDIFARQITLRLGELLGQPVLLDIEYPPGSGMHIPIAGMPWRAVAAQRPVLNPPALGQHTDEVLRELAQLLSDQHK